MKEDQQECQQQMMEILEKVSDQVKKVENINSGSMPALEGEYYTPPVSQIRVNKPRKLSAPSKFTNIFGTGASTKHRRVNRPMALPSRGGFSHPYRGSSQVSCDRVR